MVILDRDIIGFGVVNVERFTVTDVVIQVVLVVVSMKLTQTLDILDEWKRTYKFYLF